MKKNNYISSAFFLAAITVSMLFSSCYKKYNPEDYAPMFVMGGYSYVSEIAPANLVAYWNFDGNLTDSVSAKAGVGKNTSFADGYVGKALQGTTNGYVVSDISDKVKQLNSYTISFWTYYPKTTATTNKWVDIISINAANYDWGNEAQTGSWDFYKLGNNGGWGTYPDNAQATYFGCHVRNINGVSNFWDKTAWLNNLWTNNVFDNWVHWTFTYNATNSTFNIYKNATQWASDGWVGDNVYPKAGFWNPGDLKFDNPTKIIFGANTPNGPSGAMWGADIAGFDGKLDEVRIYNTVLTQPQIQAMIGLQAKGRL